IDFAYPSAPGCRPVQRSHPLIAVLAETLLGRTLAVDDNGSSAGDPSVLGRVGCWISEGVSSRATVVLLRFRHQLLARARGRETTLMVEEATALAWLAAGTEGPTDGPEALSLLAHPPADDPPRHVREREVARALALLQERAEDLEEFAALRASALLEDHLRVREASRATGSTSVQAHPRPDVIGVYSLLPAVD
ncbi:MAG: helicase SNF2, partial [Gemmatimonadota bacterium]|nr:helicase SNF2 [Gemmatimonadota bacterium]